MHSNAGGVFDNLKLSSACKSTTSKSSINHLDSDLQFKRYETDFRYVNAAGTSITLKDILMPIIGQKRAFVFKLNFREDFY